MTTMHEIRCTDLLKKRWELGANGPDAFDCWHLARALLARLGKEIPLDLVGDDYATEAEALARIRAHAGRFVHIGDTVWHASELGDFVESTTADGGRHVSVLVRDQTPKKLLTTSKATGSILVPMVSLERSCIGVWRWAS